MWQLLMSDTFNLQTYDPFFYYHYAPSWPWSETWALSSELRHDPRITLHPGSGSGNLLHMVIWKPYLESCRKCYYGSHHIRGHGSNLSTYWTHEPVRKIALKLEMSVDQVSQTTVVVASVKFNTPHAPGILASWRCLLCLSLCCVTAKMNYWVGVYLTYKLDLSTQMKVETIKALLYLWGSSFDTIIIQ